LVEESFWAESCQENVKKSLSQALTTKLIERFTGFVESDFGLVETLRSIVEIVSLGHKKRSGLSLIFAECKPTSKP